MNKQNYSCSTSTRNSGRNNEEEEDDDETKGAKNKIHNTDNTMISSFRQRRNVTNSLPTGDSTMIPRDFTLQEVVMEQNNDCSVTIKTHPYFEELFLEEEEEEESNKKEEVNYYDQQDGEESLSSSMEEDIGLNEAMLESLHVKLMALDEEIAQERNQIEQYTTNIEMLTSRQSQLQSTRNMNISLLKNVTTITNKCIQRLKKKLEEVNHHGGEISMQRVHVGAGVGDDNDNHDQEDNIVEDENHDAIIIDQTMNEIEIMDDNHNYFTTEKANKNDNIKHQTSIIHNNDYSTNNQNHKLLHDQPILIKPIENNLTYMKHIWSQNHPSTCPLFQHSTLISNPIFPLHAPISCPKKLERMIEIAQMENVLQRQDIIERDKNGGVDDSISRELLEKDYRDVIEGTCLDINACLQYDPFYVSLLPKLINKCNYEDDTALNTNESIEDDNDGNKVTHQGENGKKNLVAPLPPPTIDPNKILCRYELLGSCHDPTCTYQHLNKDITNPKKKRFVHKKGLNKISISSKTLSSKRRLTRIEDYVVSLPPLTLPTLPYSLSPEVVTTTSMKSYENNKDETTLENQALDQKYSSDDSVNVSGKELYQAQINATNSIGDESMTGSKEFDEHDTSDGSVDVHEKELDRSQMIASKPVADKRVIDRKRKADKISREDPNDYEEDFISLPSNDDESDVVEEEEYESSYDSDYMPEFTVTNDVTQEDSNNLHVEPEHLYDTLYKFNFEVRQRLTSTNLDHHHPGGLLEVSYIGYAVDVSLLPSHDEFNNPIGIVMNVLVFLSNLVDAIRLCVFSGRLDICTAITELSFAFINEGLADLKGTYSSIIEQNLRSFYDIADLVVNDVKKFSEGYFCGRGSVSFINDFHVQLGLAIISYYIRLFQQQLLEKEDFNISATDAEFLVEHYKDMASMILGIKVGAGYDLNATDSKHEYMFPSNLLPHHEISFSKKLSPSERFAIIKECFFSGQVLAREVAKDIFISGRFDDAQLILDDILLPLSNLMQTHIYSCENAVVADVIDNAMNGESGNNYKSIGLPTQLCTFILFGPCLFTIFSGIFVLMKPSKDKCEDAFLGVDLDSRQQGILVATKNMIMKFIQMFDQSGITGETLEGQLLLSPMFSMMANILLSLKSYAKAQVLLENALYGSSSNPRIWSIYSESLWSSLVQLRMCFPLQTDSKANPTLTINQNSGLGAVPLHYGLNLTKVHLKGDSSLVFSAYFFGHDIERASRSLDTLRKACMLLASGAGDVVGRKLKDLEIRFAQNAQLQQCIIFPQSIMLAGDTIQLLVFYGGNLKYLPKSFGVYLPNLKILSVAHNHLEKLPFSFLHLQKLQRLYLDFNIFKVIPTPVKFLKKLKVFSAQRNMIHDLAPLLQNKDLDTIDLRNNNITNIPANLPLQLQRLSSFYIDNNIENISQSK